MMIWVKLIYFELTYIADARTREHGNECCCEIAKYYYMLDY